MALSRADVRGQIQRHLDGVLTLEDLAAWAEEVFRQDSFEPEYGDQIAEVLSVLRDAVDPHRFRWEEPDFDDLMERLSEL